MTRTLTRAVGAGAPATEAAAQTAVRRHGAAIAPFAELIVRFGKSAEKDVVLLHRILGAPTGTLAETAAGDAWNAARRLLLQVRRIPAGPEQVRAALDVQRAMLALLNRQDDFAVAWTRDVNRAIRAARQAAAGDLPPALFRSTADAAAARVLARMTSRLPGATPELRALWKLFLGGADLTDPGVLKAAQIAAASAPEMSRLLRRRGIRAGERMSALWGHLSGVRGALGEAFALKDKVWLALRDEELLRAHKLARQLGPGYRARYLTQAEHQVMLNLNEGPDAMIVLVHEARGEMIDVTRAQVKVARVSEGAQQSANDVWRLAGEEQVAAVTGMPATYTVTVAGIPRTYSVVTHPAVQTRVVLLNAGGSRIPASQLELLTAHGVDVTEITVGLTVKQFTHLAISLCESAIKDL